MSHPISLRVSQPCPACHGKGHVSRTRCSSCLGTGSNVLQQAIARTATATTHPPASA